MNLMNFKWALLYGSVLAVLANMAVGVKADTVHLGPCLPPLGDVSTASMLVKAGDAAASAGSMQMAIADYREAMAVSPFLESAKRGLARCAAMEGDFGAAIAYYRAAISSHSYDDDIDELTEYILVLSQAGHGQEAVPLYNHIVDLCKKGYCINKMEIVPQVFRLDGSDYEPAKLQAMTHLVRAMNSSNGDDKRVSSEMQKALSLAPYSASVYFYLGQTNKSKTGHAADALAAFARARQLGGPEIKPFVDKAVQDGTAEFRAVVKEAGKAAQ